jgi:hypothetical protein
MKDRLDGGSKTLLISHLRTGVRASSLDQYLATARTSPSTASSANSPPSPPSPRPPTLERDDDDQH